MKQIGRRPPRRLEVLKEVVPSARLVAVLLESRPERILQLKDLRASAPGVGMTIIPIEAKVTDDVDGALTAMARPRFPGAELGR